MDPQKNPAAPTAPVLKIVILGDSYSGKSAFLYRFVHGKSPPLPDCTVGVDFVVTKVRLDDNDVKVQFWDTSGNSAFDRIVRFYTAGAHGFVWMYDVSRRSSLIDFEERWEHLVQQNTGVPVVLVGTKCDLVDRRDISYEEAHQFAKRLNIENHFEVSAKTGVNVEQSVITLVAKCCEHRATQQ